jgi:hypothetical protein
MNLIMKRDLGIILTTYFEIKNQVIRYARPKKNISQFGPHGRLRLFLKHCGIKVK